MTTLFDMSKLLFFQRLQHWNRLTVRASMMTLPDPPSHQPEAVCNPQKSSTNSEIHHKVLMHPGVTMANERFGAIINK